MDAISPMLAPDPAAIVGWLHAQGAQGLQCDSRSVITGDAFIAWPGAATDGRRYVADALAQGARACLVEDQGSAAFAFADPRVARCPGLKALTGLIANTWFGEPSRALDVIAVTGTNGKTSTAWWIAQAMNGSFDPSSDRSEESVQVRCGHIGTLGIGVPPDLRFTGLTTPDPVELQRALRRFVDEGLSACSIEASSIGLAEGRLDGTHIRRAVFTNLTQDHLDYHGDMYAYGEAKARLFDWEGLRAAVVGIDAPFGAMLSERLRGRALDLWTLSSHREARLSARDIGHDDQGLRFDLVEGDEVVGVRTRLIGRYNVDNLLAVAAVLRGMGMSLKWIAAACQALSPVPGRLQCQGGQGIPLVAVDYAHTPDALTQTLRALKPLARARGGQLICLFGCGGLRDRAKRPLMGYAAESEADRVVITSDNPRTEPPESIIAEIVAGLLRPQEAQIDPDRARAISAAVSDAGPHDVLLLAGKGHEEYQEVLGVKTPFSDGEQAARALVRWQRARSFV